MQTDVCCASSVESRFSSKAGEALSTYLKTVRFSVSILSNLVLSTFILSGLEKLHKIRVSSICPFDFCPLCLFVAYGNFNQMRRPKQSAGPKPCRGSSITLVNLPPKDNSMTCGWGFNQKRIYLQKTWIFSNIFKRFSLIFECFYIVFGCFQSFSNVFKISLRIWLIFPVAKMAYPITHTTHLAHF